MEIPCKDCLVLAACRYRDIVKCDKLFIWSLDIDAQILINIMNEYFEKPPISVMLADDTILTDRLRIKISKKADEIKALIVNKGKILDEE